MSNKLNKKYGLVTAICMVVGIVIGSGVFFKATSVFTNNSGSMVKSLLTVLTVGILMAICACTFSILAGKHSKINGIIDYAEAECGEGLAYTVGWFMSVIYYPVITSTLAWVSARYTCSLFGFSGDNTRLLITASYLILSFLLNAFAPRISGKFQISTTVIKLIPLAAMAIAGTVIGLINGQTVENLTATTTEIASSTGSFFGAVVAFAFAYEGWIIATCINAELHDPKKNLPKALIIGTFVVIAVYLTYFIGIASVLSVDEIIAAGEKDNLPQPAFTALFGGNEIFGTIIYVFIIISCLGTTNGVMFATCRGFYSMATRNQGPSPKSLIKLDEKSNMPIKSAIIGFAISAVWMLQWEFGFIRGMLPEFISFENDELPIITLYALYIPIFINMMRHSKGEHPAKRFLLPALSIASCLFMIFCAFYAYKIQAFYYLFIFAIVMLIGLMFYRDKKGRSVIYKFFYK